MSTSIPIPGGTNYAINVSSDGRKIYVSGGGSTTTVFDAESLKPIKVLQMETDGMDFRRFSTFSTKWNTLCVIATLDSALKSPGDFL